MTKLSKYTLEYNEQKERWDLTKEFDEGQDRHGR